MERLLTASRCRQRVCGTHRHLHLHRSGRATSCVLQDGETDKITPIEAEDRAGLKNNKNWKKSLFTDHQVQRETRGWEVGIAQETQLSTSIVLSSERGYTQVFYTPCICTYIHFTGIKPIMKGCFFKLRTTILPGRQNEAERVFCPYRS